MLVPLHPPGSDNSSQACHPARTPYAALLFYWRNEGVIAVRNESDELSKKNARGTPPIPSQIAHHIGRGEPGSHLLHTLKQIRVSREWRTLSFISNQLTHHSFPPVCRLDEQLKRHESCPESQTCTRRAYKMNREEQELETRCGLCRRWQHPWGPQFLSVVELRRVMTGFGVCQRVCHNMETLGKVPRASNQA